MPSDEELMLDVARGRNDALQELIGRYTDPVHSFIYRHTGGQDVEDIFQDTWLRVVRARRTFDPTRRFSTWLFQIALNCCRDWWRERNSIANQPAAAAPVLPGTEGRVATAIDLQRAFAALPGPQREAVILRYYHGLSEEETGRILGCPTGTVKSRVHHGLRHLRALLLPPRGER